MALKLCKRDNRYLAKLVTGKGAPCAFCLREVDDEVTFGKLYAIGDIKCHYFCCLLSCCLIQKGNDEEGLFGFMYPDIVAEIERCRKHKCSYCSRNGANLGCSVVSCRKQFHLPCGREKNAVSLYYGSYKTFCQQHAPKQRIPDHIMARAKLRIRMHRMRIKNVRENDRSRLKMTAEAGEQSCGQPSEEMVCVICYETVDGFPTVHTFWPPCCAKDAWFHRTCLQRMALSAGMHYLKCPLCNDKENFYEAVVSQGYYVPDRDAAWELEQNAFAEIYERPVSCSAVECLCPVGRSHDEETGKWDIKLCILCGSLGAHAHCIGNQSQETGNKSDQSQPRMITTDQSQLIRYNQSQAHKNSEPSNIENNAVSISQSANALNGDEITLDQSQKGTDRDVSIDQSQKNTDTDVSIDQSQKSMERDVSIDQSQKGTDRDVSIDQSQKSTERDVSIDQSQKSTNRDVSMDQSQKSTDRDVSIDQSQKSTNRDVSMDQSQKSTDRDVSIDQSQKSTDRDVSIDQSQKGTDRDALSIDQLQKSTDNDESCLDQSQKATDKEALCRYVCHSCLPAAPEDLNALVRNIEAIIQQEQAETVLSVRRLVMPSRMSLRRTKGRLALNTPSSSRGAHNFKTENESSNSPNTQNSRLQLNLKTPRKPSTDVNRRDIRGTENKLMSPVKLLEQSFREKVVCTGVRDAVLDESVIETLRRKFRKPRPLCEKKRIVDDILDGLFNDLLKNSKQKEQIKDWRSPRKCYNDIRDSKEIADAAKASKTPEKNRNQENDCNAFNTSPKHGNIFKATFKNIDTSIKNDNETQAGTKTEEKTSKNISKLSESIVNVFKSDLTLTDIQIDETSVKEKEYCVKTINFIPKKVISDSDKNNELINEINENSTNETKNKITRTPSTNENRRKTRSSLTKIVIDNHNKSLNRRNDNIDETDKEIDKNPSKNFPRHIRGTKNSPKTTDVENCEKGDLAHKIFDKVDDIQITKQNASPLKISLERKRLVNKKKSASNKLIETNVPIKDLLNSENVKNGHSPNKLTNKVLNTNGTLKPAFKGFSHQNNSILRRLLTEEDLCSQLLLELTTGKKSDKTSDNENLKRLETVSSPVELAKTLIESSNNSHDSSNKSIESLNTSLLSPSNSGSQNKSDESPKSSLESSNKSLEIESSNNSLVSPDNLVDFNIVETPKRKTIDIRQDSSLEISENDETINIDVIKIEETSNEDAYKNLKVNIPEKSKTCAFKFSPLDKETLEKNNVGIDLENFKKEYLSEVDREFTCTFKHKHVDRTCDGNKLRTAIDFAIDAANKKEVDCNNISVKNSKKRKLSEGGLRSPIDNSVVKKQKISESDLKNSHFEGIKPETANIVDESTENVKKNKADKNKRKKSKKDKRKAKKNKKITSGKNIEVTIDSSEKRSGKNKKSKKKIKSKFDIRNEDIHVRIKWKKKQFSLNIESKKQAKKEKNENGSKFKQYVLQFPEGSSKFISNSFLAKPDIEICPLKRKRVHQEKTPEKLKQMSIHNFFKMKSPEK